MNNEQIKRQSDRRQIERREPKRGSTIRIEDERLPKRIYKARGEYPLKIRVDLTSKDRIRCDDCGANWEDGEMGRDALWSHCCQ